MLFHLMCCAITETMNPPYGSAQVWNPLMDEGCSKTQTTTMAQCRVTDLRSNKTLGHDG